MPSEQYGRRAVLKALTKILSDPAATVKEKLTAAQMIYDINDWGPKPAEKEDKPKGSNLLGIG